MWLVTRESLARTGSPNADPFIVYVLVDQLYIRCTEDIETSSLSVVVVVAADDDDDDDAAMYRVTTESLARTGSPNADPFIVDGVVDQLYRGQRVLQSAAAAAAAWRDLRAATSRKRLRRHS